MMLDVIRTTTRRRFSLFRNLLIGSILACTLCVGCRADPALLAPTGVTLTTGQIRAAAAFSTEDSADRYFWLGAGLMQVEINLLRIESSGGASRNVLGAQWNFLPETMITPAVGFGVRDALSDSEEGFGIYAAVTKRLPVPALAATVQELAVTAGIGAGGIKGPFFSAEARLPSRLILQLEYDSRDLNGALAWEPVPPFRLKAYSIRSEFYLGAEIAPLRF